MSEIGFHPEASAVTSEEARQGRSEMDLAIASDPAMARALGTKVLESPRSPEALQMLAASAVNAMAAFARSDWEINTYSMHPTRFEFEAGREQSKVMIDLPPRLVGVGEYIRGMRDFLSVWTPYEFVTEGVAVAPNSSVLHLGVSRGLGAGSGVPHETAVAFLYEWEEPWIVSQRYWWDHDLAMKQAGVDPAAILAVSPR